MVFSNRLIVGHMDQAASKNRHRECNTVLGRVDFILAVRSGGFSHFHLTYPRQPMTGLAPDLQVGAALTLPFSVVMLINHLI